MILTKVGITTTAVASILTLNMLPSAEPSATAGPSGNFFGFRAACDQSELIFGPYTLPLPSGTFTRSRGIETVLT